MKKYTHIVFGDSATGLVRYYFSQHQHPLNGDVICFGDDLSIGPIDNLDSLDGVTQRQKWLNTLYTASFPDYLDHGSNNLQDYSQFGNINEKSTVIIWHARNVRDQTCLAYLCNKLNKHILYEIDVHKYNDRFVNKNGYALRSLAECNISVVGELIEEYQIMHPSQKQLLSNQWISLSQSDSSLRIFSKDKVKIVPINYYDDEILNHCTRDYIKAAKVIGLTMGNTNQLVSDTFIQWRLKYLVNIGDVDYTGELLTMRDYKVKKV